MTAVSTVQGAQRDDQVSAVRHVETDGGQAMNAARPETRQPAVGTVQRAVLVSLLLLGIWLFSHPWEGIWHDGRLYALQALSRLRPDAYAKDLFFFSGSQDDYTFFSPLYAALISLMGLHAAAITLQLAAYLLWLGAAAWLLGSLLQGFPFWLGLTLIVAMPRGYGGSADLLRYAESFLTPRLIAEGLTLLSLAMMLRGKRLAALATLSAAFAMHPLMALAGAGWVGFHAAMKRPRVVLGAAAVGLALLSGLVFLAVAPFDRLLLGMDPQWFEQAFARSPFVFWDGWRPEDWLNRVLLSFSLLATAGLATQDAQRRVFLAGLLVGGSALLLTWLGTSLLHNALLIQLQPWRSLWLVQLFSYIAAAGLVARFWQRGEVYRVLLLGFLAASVTLDSAGGVLALLCAALFIRQARSGKEIAFSGTAIRLLYLMALLLAVLWLANAGLVAATEPATLTGPRNHLVGLAFHWIRELLAGGGSAVLAIGLFLAVWRYAPDQRKFVHLGALAGVLFLLFLSMAMWYRPNPRQRYYEQRALQDPIPSFTRQIPIDALVYWENDVTMSWFALARANYASTLQTAGTVFSRRTAIEGKRRMDRLRALGPQDSMFDWWGHASGLPVASVGGLLHLCHDPLLDYAVLSQDFGAGVMEQYFDPLASQRFYLYDCAWLRQNFADTWTSLGSGRKSGAAP
ncbi:MAG: hypothetical protein PHS32_08645 [Rhodoferax sp.]|uniref:hypothetical protein n=1 Tax=Rhodoferax sp. TaxID=50421 RepID=UPI002620B111|nr:hypothetical protein [Rhodoferax sp.]MDD5333802.1 hypothetical protein [Rhodoferax sp.]